MKKGRIVAALLLVLFVPFYARAAALYSGTTNFTFTNGDSTSVNWAVYDKNAANPYTAASSNYVYAYTINGWANYPNLNYAELNVVSPNASSIPVASAGYTKTATSGSVSLQTLAGEFKIQVNGPALSSGNTVTAWLASSWAPGTASGQMDNGYGYVSNGSQTIYAPSTTAVSAPGAPEPHTWALLLALIAFTTWRLRRRNDGSTLQTTVNA